MGFHTHSRPNQAGQAAQLAKSGTIPAAKLNAIEAPTSRATWQPIGTDRHAGQAALKASHMSDIRQPRQNGQTATAIRAPRPYHHDQAAWVTPRGLLMQLDDIQLDYAGDAIDVEQFQLSVRRHGAFVTPIFDGVVRPRQWEELFQQIASSSSATIQN
jgi:hypothetical protein